MDEETTRNLPDGDLKLILSRFDSVDARLDSVDTRLDSIDTRLDFMDNRLAKLEDKVDRRLQETRPIWESVLEQLKEANARLTRVEEENKDFRRMFRSTLSDISRTQGDLEERIDKLEGGNVPQ